MLLRHRQAIKGEEIMKAIAASVLALALLPSGAHAATRYSMAAVCNFDIDQYCRGMPKTRIRELKECLAKHEKDLLPRCQDHYKDAQ
jgi:hypothetical protein